MESAGVAELLRMMRLIVRKSQAEYARMCGVAPRVLTNIEGGVGSPTVETLEKLLRPFGFQVGVVMRGAENGIPAKREADDPSALSRALERSRQRRG
jgi:transcriptional regulator with XRE-family HTH domain